MLALLLMTALASDSVGDKLIPYRGQPVLSVTIDAPPDEDQAFLVRLIDIQPGYLVSAQDLQAAIKRLYALGRFANVYVDAQRVSGVVMLRFRLRPTRRLDELDIRGLALANEGALRAALGIKAGDEASRATAAQLEAAAQAHLQAVGFPAAQVSVKEGPVNPDTAKQALTMFVQEGAPRRVAEVLFTGNPRVPAHGLREVVSTRVVSVLDHKRLVEDRATLERAYLERGFLQAQVGAPVVSASGAQWRVAFPIEAGDRVGVDFAGNKAVGDAVLFALWPFSDRRVDAARLERFADRVQEHYLRLGYANVQVQVRGWRDAAEGFKRYLLEVHEGELVRVVDIQFPGAETIPAETLQEQVRAVLSDELENKGSLITQFFLETAGETPAWGRPDFEPRYESAVDAAERWVPELYEQALEGIRAVYRDRGYLDATLGEPQVLAGPSPNTAIVRVDVREGAQTTIAALRFRGNLSVPSAEALEIVETTQSASGVAVALGGPYTPSGLEEARIALVHRYRDHGYLFARVFTEANIAESGLAEVVYRVEEGPQVRVRNVLVRGNRNTSLDTILAQMNLAPGDLYRLDQALADRRAVARLGLFNNVEVRLIDEDRPEEQKDVVVEVIERERHQVGMLIGFSTADGFRLGGSYTHLNLFGNATQLNLDARFNIQFLFSLYGDRQAALRDRYESYWSDAAYKALERDLRAGIRSRRLALFPQGGTTLRLDLTNQRDNSLAFSLDETAFTAGAELSIADVVNVAVDPQISFSDLECPEVVAPGDEDCVTAVQVQRSRPIERGQRFTFKVGPNITLDLRDNRLNPQSGVWANAQAVWAWGIARQHNNQPFAPFSFAKVEAAVVGYIPLFGPILVLNARGGYLTQLEGAGVPIDERFFLGGRNTLRGFVENTLVPEDVCLDTGTGQNFDPARCKEVYQIAPGQAPITRGGNTYVLLRTELRIPLTESLRAELFVDLGNLWALTPTAVTFRPRVGLGAGLRWETAVGALIADLGFNPEVRPGEFFVEPHFSVSNF